jgi:hypothetical protein
MMNIGDEKRVKRCEPLENPIPARREQPKQDPVPLTAPAKEPAKPETPRRAPTRVPK